MAKNIFEVRFHSRAGQGAKSAAAFLAEAALSMGLEMQAFPDYGPERGGAPMRAYVRISKKPIFTFAPITEPDVVLVLDDSLLDKGIVQGLTKGKLIVNTKKGNSQISQLTGFKGDIYTLDATGIALDLIGKNFPNLPILGALIKLTKVVDLRFINERIKKKFLEKLGEEMTKNNILAIKKGYEVVK